MNDIFTEPALNVTLKDTDEEDEEVHRFQSLDANGATVFFVVVRRKVNA